MIPPILILPDQGLPTESSISATIIQSGFQPAAHDVDGAIYRGLAGTGDIARPVDQKAALGLPLEIDH